MSIVFPRKEWDWKHMKTFEDFFLGKETPIISYVSLLEFQKETVSQIVLRFARIPVSNPTLRDLYVNIAHRIWQNCYSIHINLMSTALISKQFVCYFRNSRSKIGDKSQRILWKSSVFNACFGQICGKIVWICMMWIICFHIIGLCLWVDLHSYFFFFLSCMFLYESQTNLYTSPFMRCPKMLLAQLKTLKKRSLVRRDSFAKLFK